jgi:hypothetical protein
MAVSATAAYLALKKLHRDLPDTMRTDMDRNQVGDPALKKVIELCGLYEGDFAGALGRIHMLLRGGAVKARKLGDGWVELTKAEFPEPDDPRDWVERENEKIRQAVANETARRNREFELERNATEQINVPVIAAKRADFAFLLAEHGLTGDKLAATLEAAVERVLQAYGLLETATEPEGSVQMVGAGEGPQER